METTGEEGKIQVKRKKAKRKKTIFDIVKRSSDNPKNRGQRY